MSPRRDDAKMRPGLFVGGVLTAAVLATGAVIFGAVACSTDQISKGLSGQAPATSEQLLAELRTEKARIDRISDDMMRRIETYNTSARPGQRTINFSEVFYNDLSGEQRDILNAMLAEERDLSYRSLIGKIIEDRDTIHRLQDKVLRMEQSLPDEFVVAKQGESHFDLAMTYLVEDARLEEAKAKKVLGELDLSDVLLPGNKVWFFYNPEQDRFRTYITRGEAGQTPLAIRRAMKRRLISERDAAVAQVGALEQSLQETRHSLEAEIAAMTYDLQELSKRRWTLEKDVSSLAMEEARLSETVARLAGDLAKQENSLFYHAAVEKDLRDLGTITPIFKRFRDSKDVAFDRALDLRTSTSITLSAADFGMEEIKKVRVLPSIYEPERDYVVERSEDGGSITVLLLDPEIFRGREVLLSVRG